MRRKVAIAGATGTLGKHILQALSTSDRYEITAIIRQGSQLGALQNVQVVPVDFTIKDDLIAVLTGHEILVSVLGKGALALQPLLIDAAVAAGVKRILPSEFGSDLRNSKTRQFPTYRPKILVEEQLERHSSESEVTYTLIYTNCLLDWGILNENGLLLNPRDRTARLFDGGNIKFSTTTMATAGRAVVAALDHYEETANRALCVHDVVITQNELLEMAKAVTANDGGKAWTSSVVSTEGLEHEAWSACDRKEIGSKVFYGFAARAAFGQGYGGHFVLPDNEFLGIQPLSEEGLQTVVRKAVLNEL